MNKDGTGAALVSEGDFEDLAIGARGRLRRRRPAAGRRRPRPRRHDRDDHDDHDDHDDRDDRDQPAGLARRRRQPRATHVTITIAKGRATSVRWRGKAPAWKVTLRVGKKTATARVKGTVHSHTFVLHNAKGTHRARVPALSGALVLGTGRSHNEAKRTG